MRGLLIFALIVIAAHAISDEDEWRKFKLRHGKSYKNTLEEKRRFATFQKNLRTIVTHNELYANGESTFFMGIDEYADLTYEEFAVMMNIVPVDDKYEEDPDSSTGETYTNNDDEVVLPVDASGNVDINYVTEGLVTEVKKEGNCSSSYVISALGAIEGQVAKHNNQLKSLSPQNVIDCDTASNGCQGGDPVQAYHYIIKYGVAEDADYPYVGEQGLCKKVGGLKISKYQKVKAKNEIAVLNDLVKIGPLSMVIDYKGILFYKGGVLDEHARCTNKTWDHSVLAVGAGTEEGVDYFLMKNSWGPSWGADGYFKIKRSGNICGILLHTTYPKL